MSYKFSAKLTGVNVPEPTYIKKSSDLKNFTEVALKVGEALVAGWPHTIRLGGNFYKKIRDRANLDGRENADIVRMEKYARSRAGGASASAAVKTEEGTSGVKAEPDTHSPPPPTAHDTHTAFHTRESGSSGSGCVSSSFSSVSSSSSEEKGGGETNEEKISKIETELLAKKKAMATAMKEAGKADEEIEKITEDFFKTEMLNAVKNLFITPTIKKVTTTPPPPAP